MVSISFNNSFKYSSYWTTHPLPTVIDFAYVLAQCSCSQLLNPQNIVLASGKPAPQYEYYFESSTIHPNGAGGFITTPSGNRIHIAGIAMIEGGTLYAVEYFPDLATPDYMPSIMYMANSL
jgi:hypothetical protein